MEREMKEAGEGGISAVVFGDIFLEDVRKYREENLSKVSMKGVFPLWKRNSRELIKDFISARFSPVLWRMTSFMDASLHGERLLRPR